MTLKKHIIPLNDIKAFDWTGSVISTKFQPSLWRQILSSSGVSNESMQYVKTVEN